MTKLQTAYEVVFEGELGQMSFKDFMNWLNDLPIPTKYQDSTRISVSGMAIEIKKSRRDKLAPIRGGEITYWVPKSELDAERASPLTRQLQERLRGFVGREANLAQNAKKWGK